MTPEQALLLEVANPYPTEEDKARIHQRLQTTLNWSEIMEQASNHGLSQLLFHTIQQIDPGVLPTEVQETLRGRFDWAILRNLFLTGELLRVIKLLGEGGITAVPFKGPMLAEKLYKNLALRVFGDLDILISPEDSEKAKALLVADGYQSQPHADSALQLVKPNANVVLEVHWKAISLGSDWLRKLKDKPMPGTLDHLSPRLKEAQLGGKGVTTLSIEDTLLILTIHGSKHWWSRLNWLADIAALLHAYPELDWDWVMEQVSRWQVRRLVLLGLSLAQDLLSAPLPDNIQREITAEPSLKKLSELAQSMFLVEQNLQTRYIKRPAYFRQLWDSPAERRALYIDHTKLYLRLITRLFIKNPGSRK